MTLTVLNRNGWRKVDPPIAGVAASCIPGQLIARDDKTGIGILKKQDGTQIKIHVQWFERLEPKEVSVKQARPTRAAKVDPMKELLKQLIEANF